MNRKMPIFIRNTVLFIAVVLLGACRHPLAIEGEGDIIERSFGHRGCSLEEFQANGDRCSENEVSDEDYIVSYEAAPRPGWAFYRWAGTPCDPGSLAPYCDYNLNRRIVNSFDEKHPEADIGATTAIFIEQPNETLVVSSHANGGFSPLLGGPEGGGDMVAAAVLSAGDVLVVEASGTINIATNRPDGAFTQPDGIDASGADRPSAFVYYPLEEAGVDSGEIELPFSIEDDLVAIGGLIGAFIPQHLVLSAEFIARNNDPDPDSGNFPSFVPEVIVTGSVPAESLVLVGSGPFLFEVPEDGVFFLGINDADTSNNEGEYIVSISVE